jgi:pimeloyl-ACP methyl ester carboxylesterase
VSGLARFRSFVERLVATFSLSIFILATFSFAQPVDPSDGAAISRSQETPSSIVVGFVGGFVRANAPNHGPVDLGQKLERDAPKGAYVKVFENRRRKTAYDTILRLLDRNHDGVLDSDEKAQARIVLFGHSWGASTVVLLARDLNRIGVPVLLTVQVDSVAKMWQDDRVIPGNVVAAANFYQPNGLVRGQEDITAADPKKTQILGNYRFDYRKDPVQCGDALSWYNRFFTPGHAHSECDPHLWSRVEDLVRRTLTPGIGIATAVSQQPGR